jgi:hypothetical protein
MNIEAIIKVGRARPTRLDMSSLIFPGPPSSSEKALAAQAKACGYRLSMYPLTLSAKSQPDTTGVRGDFAVSAFGYAIYLMFQG